MKKYISLSLVFAALLALGNLFMVPGDALAALGDPPTTYRPNDILQSQGVLGVDQFGNVTAEDPNVDYGQNKGTTAKSGGSGGGGGNIFSIVTGKAAKALAGVKKVVYVLAGFGLIAFAFMAIFNKISWKWFANIAIGLFLVASMGIFIDYFVTPGGGANGRAAGGYKLAYGSYLSSAFDDISGSTGESFGGASDESLNQLDNSPIGGPLTPAGDGGIANSELNLGLSGITTPGTGVGENSSLDDGTGQTGGKKKRGIKGMLSDAKNLIKTGVEIKQGMDNAVNTYKTVKNEYDRVANAIQNNGGGIGGILSSVQDVSQGLQNATDATMSGAKNISSNLSNAANTTQNVGKTAEEIKQLEYQRMEKANTNKVSQWLSSDGAGGSVLDVADDFKKNHIDTTLGNTQEAAARGQDGVAMVEKGGLSGSLGLVAGIGAGVAMGGSELLKGVNLGGKNDTKLQTYAQNNENVREALQTRNSAQQAVNEQNRAWANEDAAREQERNARREQIENSGYSDAAKREALKQLEDEWKKEDRTIKNERKNDPTMAAYQEQLKTAEQNLKEEVKTAEDEEKEAKREADRQARQEERQARQETREQKREERNNASADAQELLTMSAGGNTTVADEGGPSPQTSGAPQTAPTVDQQLDEMGQQSLQQMQAENERLLKERLERQRQLEEEAWAAQQKEEADKKAKEDKSSGSPELAAQIKKLQNERDEKLEACDEAVYEIEDLQYSKCQSIQDSKAYNDCLAEVRAQANQKQKECSQISSEYAKRIQELQS